MFYAGVEPLVLSRAEDHSKYIPTRILRLGAARKRPVAEQKERLDGAQRHGGYHHCPAQELTVWYSEQRKQPVVSMMIPTGYHDDCPEEERCISLH